ncbi:hypothetical protein [Amycolatopsis sp. 195334CR]|uniref:hypothetical protein n=1 Tax=Amycolatopsis sp. 195334CR TaxID=2814588 RepID=UPI001A8D0154|nr:hypothetical protein [Amycolatopsis sp. 195334CR]MBN6040687.1 hypothetical protein [Amycolatopsis sp. 195334CR]
MGSGEQPSARTAMLAVVLAAVMGAFFTAGVLSGIDDLVVRAWLGGSLALTLVWLFLDAVCAVGCLLGAVLLGTRKPVGRVLVVFGAAVVVLRLVLGSVVAVGQTGGAVVLLGAAVLGLVPVSTLVAVLRPATKAWLTSRPTQMSFFR